MEERKQEQSEPLVRRSRALKGEPESTIDPIVTSVVGTDLNGKSVSLPLQAFDMSKLESIASRPYRVGETLPPAEKKISDRTGVEVVVKPGDPRFYFQGNELIRIWMDRTKKRRLFWQYKPKNKVHVSIRKWLKSKGFPGA